MLILHTSAGNNLHCQQRGILSASKPLDRFSPAYHDKDHDKATSCLAHLRSTSALHFLACPTETHQQCDLQLPEYTFQLPKTAV